MINSPLSLRRAFRRISSSSIASSTMNLPVFGRVKGPLTHPFSIPLFLQIWHHLIPLTILAPSLSDLIGTRLGHSGSTFPVSLLVMISLLGSTKPSSFLPSTGSRTLTVFTLLPSTSRGRFFTGFAGWTVPTPHPLGRSLL
ncbi:hypothetical protein ACFX16_007141 [Malus domestica]